MKDYIMTQLAKTTELLQYFTGSTVITQADKTFTAANIGTGLTAGEKIVIAGAANSASNGTFTLVTVAAGAISVHEAIGADETASITINQEYQSDWIDVRKWAKLTGSIYSSGNAYVYIDQSSDGYNTDYTTTRTITAATADAWSIETVLPFARMRVRTNAADQTAMRAYLYGRIIT
jgi:hypothetical protein